MTISVEEPLVELGFDRDPAEQNFGSASFHRTFGNLTLRATECLNRWYRPVWLFDGIASDSRTIAQIEFEMPLAVESREQGIAWIAEHLSTNTPLQQAPDWLQQGLAWRDELPWRKVQFAHEGRPRCTVGRDWFRLPCRTLRQLGETAERNDRVEVSFDGEALKFRTLEHFLVSPASGFSWDRPVAVELTGLRHLPQRLMRPIIEVSVWEAHLCLSRRLFPLID